MGAMVCALFGVMEVTRRKVREEKSMKKFRQISYLEERREKMK